jgi:hypothetical protein
VAALNKAGFAYVNEVNYDSGTVLEYHKKGNISISLQYENVSPSKTMVVTVSFR